LSFKEATTTDIYHAVLRVTAPYFKSIVHVEEINGKNVVNVTNGQQFVDSCTVEFFISSDAIISNGIGIRCSRICRIIH